MTKLLTVVTLLTVGLTAAAFAATPKASMKPAKKMMAATCPFCKMPLGTKMTKALPVAIKMNGKTYYTCAPCKSKVAAMKKPMKMAM